ncbi:MAG: MurR/RpiR family transcriptional regulator [bacterium]
MSLNPSVPGSQEAVIQRLLEQFDQLPTQLQIAARYIIDHPREVGVQTMRSLAGEAGVHPNTFVRLARNLGFSGYDALRERFRDFVRGGVGSSQERARWLQSMARTGGVPAVSGQMAEAVLKNIEQLFKDQQLHDTQKAANWMINAPKVYVAGVGSSYALAYNFWYVARMMFPHFVMIPRHGSLPMDDLLHIDKHDVLFAMTFQPYRVDILDIVKFANSRKARTIGLSDSPASPVCRYARLGLHVQTHTPHFFHSNAAPTAMLETICALMVAEGGESVVSQIEKFNELRWQSGIYQN